MVGYLLVCFAFVLAICAALRGWASGAWASVELGWLALALYFLSLLLRGGG